MKSGLYSTFTIQSLQAPCRTSPQPIKTELLNQDSSPRPHSADRTLREVRAHDEDLSNLTMVITTKYPFFSLFFPVIGVDEMSNV
jgi:hypothetical protein